MEFLPHFTLLPSDRRVSNEHYLFTVLSSFFVVNIIVCVKCAALSVNSRLLKSGFSRTTAAIWSVVLQPTLRPRLKTCRNWVSIGCTYHTVNSYGLSWEKTQHIKSLDGFSRLWLRKNPRDTIRSNPWTTLRSFQRTTKDHIQLLEIDN